MSKEELIKVAEMHYEVQYAKYRERGYSRDMASVLACAFLEAFMKSFAQTYLEKLSKEERPRFLSMVYEVEKEVGLWG
ncbi:MAG: hypothetical protein ACRDDX_09435 [Cellulosilyticaceae bacterium]